MEIGIIGGGASGMMLASMLKNKKVRLLEKNNKLGKKLLLTGNGKCNFTNDDFSNLDSIYNNDLAKKIYERHDKNEFLRYITQLGILPKIEVHRDKKYYYPNSNKAISVYYALYDKIIDNHIEIVYNCDVVGIKLDKGRFVVSSKDNEYVFDKLVISTGGITYKKTGSDGVFYNVIKNIGHSIIKPVKSLCGFCYDDIDLNRIKGVRVDAKAYIKTDDNIFCEMGEIQFTENGISGIPIMNLSRRVNRLIDNGAKLNLHLDFAIGVDSISKFLYNRRKDIGYKNSSDFLSGFIPDELADIILKRCGINCHKVSNIDDNLIENIAKELTDFIIFNINIPSIDNAQLTLGGVNTSDIKDNLESKIVKNLYFIGEVVDIDGPCGGYNLQLAYSTAAEVASNI